MRQKTSLPADTPPTPSSTGSSSHEAQSPSEPAREASSASGARAAAVVLRRRGHFKSRLGCFNCKRRRVKCNETRPECGPCRRLALSCEYPPSPNSSPTDGAPPPLRATLSGLALEDLRFYHQFLTVAYPSLPLKGGEVWSNCAAMSHSVSLPFPKRASLA